MKGDGSLLSKEEFIQAITKYLDGVSCAGSTGCTKCSKFCICGVNHGENWLIEHRNFEHVERLDLQEKQLEVCKNYDFNPCFTS